MTEDDFRIAHVPEDSWTLAKWYKYTQDGEPVFGHKTEAAAIPSQFIPMVLKQLQAMMPEAEFEVDGAHIRFKRKK